jgi:hypothetical protein
MLEYCKTVLSKVSFDKSLFEKELVKSIQKLLDNELKALKKWCYKKFGKIYLQILNKHFGQVAL